MNSKKLVSVFAKEESISSYEFWKVLNKIRKSKGASYVKHNHFLTRVIDEIDDLPLGKSFTPSRSSESITVYDLSKDQMLLVGMRESKIVRKQVLEWLHNLTDKVSELEFELKQQKINRANSSLNYIEQNDTLKRVRDLEGKITKPHHYSNEANLVNRIVLGMTAKAYRKDNEFDLTVNLRDTLTVIELAAVAALEECNTAFIKGGIDYATRKYMLSNIYDRDFKALWLAEDFKLNA